MVHQILRGARRRSARAIFSFVLLSCVALCGLFFLHETPAQTDRERPGAGGATPVLPAPLSAAPYATGERLTYNVSFATYPSAAYVELGVVGRTTTTGGREAIELSAHIETTGVVSAALYAANDDYRSFVDPRTGAPLRTTVRARDANQPEDLAREYNQPVGNDAIPARSSRLPIGGTFDLLSAIYRARSLPLAVNSAYRFQIVAGQGTGETYDVDFRVTGGEVTKTSVGSYNTIVATARPRLSKTYETRIHFTADERRVPVLVVLDHPAGEIRAELVSSSLPAAPPAADIVAETNVRPPATIAPGANTSSLPAVVSPARPNSNTANTDPAATPRPGEQLNYSVFLGTSTQPVGAVFFDVRGRGRYFSREGLHVIATARTSGLGEQLFPVQDRFSSYLDPATMLPFRTEVELREGSRRLSRVLSFEQENGAFVREDGLRTEMPSGTYDLASLVYALRLFDLTPPRRTSLSVLASNRTHAVTIAAVSRERITVGGTELPAIQLAVTTGGREPDRNGYRLWISDDGRRLPLRFTAQTPLGLARAELAIIPVVRQ